MDLTTSALVKAYLTGAGATVYGSDIDALLAELVSLYSARFLSVLGRLAEKTERVVDLDVRARQTIFSLPAYPIDTGETFTLVNDPNRSFTGAAVSSSNYVVKADLGAFVLDVPELVPGYGVLRVTYTGGMGADAASIAAAFPEIAELLAIQVAHHLQRRETLGATNVSGGDGNVGFPGTLNLLPMVRQGLAPYRRKWIA